jgi:hypothetical protein
MAIRGNHSHLPSHEIGCQCWQPVVSILREAVFDRYVLSVDIAGFFQAPYLSNRKASTAARRERRWKQDVDARHRAGHDG